MASSDAVYKAIKVLKAAFPSARFDDRQAPEWARLLDDVTDEQLRAGAENIARKGSWFPTLPELRKMSLASGAGQIRGGDNLARLRFGLEQRAAGGEFDADAWERLAQAFEQDGRESAAESVRRRAAGLADPLSGEERQRYVECQEVGV